MENKTQSYLLFFKSEDFPCWDPIHSSFPLDQKINFYAKNLQGKVYKQNFLRPVTLSEFVRKKNLLPNFNFQYFTLADLDPSHILYFKTDPPYWKDAFYFI
jgi:hypothetical protein